MIRPIDQARLLFLYLLRSSSAAMAVVRESGTIALRLARKSDIPMIQKCNLATLPENYSCNFYNNHMRQWPDLALVAEVVNPPSQKKRSKISWNNGINQLYSRQDDNTEKGNQIIGYVLGKVEHSPSLLTHNTRSDNNNNNNNNNQARLPRSVVTDDDDEDLLSSYLYPSPQRSHNQQMEQQDYLGHVTSLAVLKPYRRCGVAAELMRQLHHHMQQSYPSAGGVGLHVRVSNVAACKLYQQGLGYEVLEVIPGYYQDGEDAYFMQKQLQMITHPSTSDDTNTNNRSNSLNQHQVSMYTSSKTSYEPRSRISKIKGAISKLTLRGETRNAQNQVANWIASPNINNKDSTSGGLGLTDFKLPRYLPIGAPNDNPENKITKKTSPAKVSPDDNSLTLEPRVTGSDQEEEQSSAHVTVGSC
eukprot:CAMPEP_0197825836 /NCGR_PEP_ID=MMETSP1437-20131217/2867_1 /TAXON_ID=49252 ORGANISM="Eucampia antarctica, Strain CCMP1452" /NCGR_SAMPLE_ID=MMETSP1437 /ASSEMBLY_ACC=CAM_ASM_001096 /LENGTH=416 /DNA_ID=CAMNT_0043426005 /DNA_START=73 /DNA_END=1323 /DNA_ORIENTATION=-